MKNRLWVFWVISASMLLADQLVKAWIRGAIPQRGSLGGLPWPGVFEITLTYNEGIAFGLFQGAGVLLAPVAVAIAVAAGWHSIRHPEDSGWSHAAMGLLVAGALGNLYDRVAHGRVTDMFYFRLIDFPVFNVADACITVATGFLIVLWWRDALKKQRGEVATEESQDSGHGHETPAAETSYRPSEVQ